jgi:cytoskeletal protein CcmA (bactofilin family)
MSFWNKIEKPGSEPLPATPPPRAVVPPATHATPAPAVQPPPVAPEREALTPPAPAVREDPPPRRDHLRIGRGVKLEGKLTFSGTVRVDATFQGSIIADGVLVVGEEATVDADIRCSGVVVEGKVKGNIVARDEVEIRRSGAVRGDVETPALSVERGALFDGTSRRPSGAAAGAAKAAATAPKHTTH